MIIANKNNCTGCSACYNICPSKAIRMEFDSEGFLQPFIQQEICIGCKKCQQICPLLRNNSIITPVVSPNIFVAINKDENVRKDSSSGGLFYIFAKYVLEKEGVVFGAQFNENWNVEHTYTEELNDIKKFQGSKYIQSTVGTSYSDCERFLNENRLVLFTGTPCQIQGLKQYLRKSYDNLIAIDLICHGVPSPKIWKEFLRDFISDKNRDIEYISFRDKFWGWKKYALLIKKNNNEKYHKTQIENEWMLAFNKNIMMRKSCYNCKAKAQNIVSDITLGDFWGIEQYYPELDDNKGTSVVICNNDKGLNLIKLLDKDLIIKKIDNYDIKKYNTQLFYPLKNNSNREKFIRLTFSNGFLHAYEKYVKDKKLVVLYKNGRKLLGKIKRKIIGKNKK